ncbi:MAG: Ig-like domain-containing protein [Clostridiales bacterium]|jgi:arabinan endo-1,5-alpha-L-arabinosidase|nr:Ig-like domain-containing protein [Clostridiales bacterium]
MKKDSRKWGRRMIAFCVAIALALPSLALPVYATPGSYTLHEWKFDNNLNHTISVDGGTPSNGTSATVTGVTIGASGGMASYNTLPKSGTHAFSFKGSTGVNLGTGLVTSDTYTISLWVYPSAPTNFTPAFFGSKNAIDNGAWLSIVPQTDLAGANSVVMARNGSDDQFPWYNGSTKATVGKWTHFVVVVSANNIAFYVNGANATTGTDFFDLFSNGAGSFYLGVNYWDTPFQGRIDEVRIYDNAEVNAAGVAQLYNLTNPSAENIIVPKVEGGTVGTEPEEKPGYLYVRLSSNISLKKGNTLNLKPLIETTLEEPTFTCSAKAIATVSAQGVIKAVKAGKTVITIKAGDLSVKITLTVNN